MEKFVIKGEFITLGQFIKAANFVSSGGMVKPFLEETSILLNGIKENRRNKKIYPKDELTIDGKVYLFVKWLNTWKLGTFGTMTIWK